MSDDAPRRPKTAKVPKPERAPRPHQLTPTRLEALRRPSATAPLAYRS